METEELLVNFYNGMHALEMVATWTEVGTNGQAVLEKIDSFEEAYERLIDLHDRGRLGVGDADFSAENLERVKHLRRLVQQAMVGGEAPQTLAEIRALSEQCVRALKRNVASDAPQDAS